MQILTFCFVVCLCRLTLATPSKFFYPRVSLARKVKGLYSGLGIVGGSTASIKTFPYQAAILTPTGYFIGSGSIIGKKYILTSAFLVDYYDTLQVRVGSATCTEGGQLLITEKIIIHEKYDVYSYDVALLKLKKTIKYGKTVKPIKLASKAGKNATSVVVSGYGFTAEQLTQEDFGYLVEGKQSVFIRNSCENYYATLDESNSCAYSATVCACGYDYGDPLVQKKKLLGYYVGGSSCCYDDYPQIYSNVPTIKKWVKEKMKVEGYDIKEDIGHYYGEDIYCTVKNQNNKSKFH